MATTQANVIIRQLRRAALRADGAGLTDGQLLECFVSRRDEAAFEALVRRHGSMVMGICRRVTGHDHDAQDAFQASFLVLARKAAAVSPREAVGNWLCGVAYRTARRARAVSARRHVRERQVNVMPQPMTKPDGFLLDLVPLLDDELDRLADKYRLPVVLCELEGRSRREVAAQLKIPEGTLSSRLATARKLLAGQLARRGLAVTVAVVAEVLTRNMASAAVPSLLVATTARAATLYAAGQVVGSDVIPVKVVTLAQGVLKMIYISRLQVAGALVLVVSLLGAGMAALADFRQPPANPQTPPAAKFIAAPVTEQESMQPAAILKEAKKAADAIEDKQWQAWTLQEIAVIQLKCGERDAAAETFKDAIKAAGEIRGANDADPKSQAWHTMTWIAEAQAASGDLKAAMQTVEQIDDDGQRDYALAMVASARARNGDTKGALETADSVSFNKKNWVRLAVVQRLARAEKFQEASDLIEKITDTNEKAQALVALAGAQARAKDTDAAKKSLAQAQKLGNDLDPETDWPHALAGYIAEIQVQLGDAKGARQTAESISKERYKSRACTLIAVAQARLGDIKGAFETADAIADEFNKGETLKEVMDEQLQARDLKAAQQSVQSIKSVYWRVEALAEIAKAQAKAGNNDAATATFRKALEEAGKDGDNVRDNEPGFGGLRNAVLCHLARAQAEAAAEKEAYAWAVKQDSPLLKAKALHCVAEGIALRKEAAKQPEK